MNFDISGAAIYLRIPTGIPVLGDFVITETMVVSWLVMILITGFCIWLTRDLRVENISKRQAVAEMLVEQATNLVRNNTGGTKFDYLIPFVAALFTTSAVSNLISLTGLRSPKGFTTPIPVMTPFNILSEIATPISMACRHFGNILSGVVINGLLYAALAVASSALLGWLPGALGEILGSIPILDVGIPAILSVYFDWFSGLMQAFIFSMLTIMYIANAAEG